MESESDFMNDLTSSDESVSINSILKSFVCTYQGCKASFYKHNKLVYHLRKHSGERPYACNIGDCKKAYTNNTHLRRHMKTHEPKTKKLICPKEGCGKILATSSTLKMHIIRSHEKTKSYPFTCSECQQGFSKKKQLQQHSYLHTGVLPFQCEICYEQFQTMTGLNKHKSRHKTYTCVCEKVFERWSELCAHKKICQKIDYTCKICEKSFTNNNSLHRHVRGHLETNSYKCPKEGCERIYHYKKNLDFHIRRIHEKIKPNKIPCPVEGCTATLSKMQNLKNHLEKIHSEKQEKSIIRAPRKDKGSFHKSTAIELAALKLSKESHETLIKGGKINVNKLRKKRINTSDSESECSYNSESDKSEDDENNENEDQLEIDDPPEFFDNSCKEKVAIQEINNPLLKS